MEVSMKVLIAGSRSIKNFDLSKYIPENTTLIISGGAEGVDTIAENYADSHSISKLIVRPDYKKYGRCAPIKRNEFMVDIANMIIVIWDGKSKGSLYTINYAEKKNKDRIIIKAQN